MNRTPNTVPVTVPLPPVSAVPPRSTAAMAFRGRVSSTCDVVAPVCATTTTPARAAHAPEMAKTIMMTRRTLMPDSRAATWFPPHA